MREELNAALDGRYAIERELGRGGMAAVWLARDVLHGRAVAIKVLHPELAGAIGVDRFIREIEVTARLQHPHVVPVLDSGVFPGARGVTLPWYAMAYVPGESLRARLTREQHLPIDEAVRLTREAAEALSAAHRQGIVHRDIKPENLLLAGEHVYVADFGIAKALIETGGDRLTSTGLALGTPAYMSPEQAAAQPVDARSDQYSLAAVLYEMLVGEPPFTGPSAQVITARRLSETPRPVRPVRPLVPEHIERALLRALERLPADRFPDVTGFAEALAVAPATARHTRAAPAGWSYRIAAGALLLGALALGAWLVGRPAAPRGRDPAAVALYRRGLHAYDVRTPASIIEAAQAFGAAVGRDSTYAEAWSGLARTYSRALERRFVIPGLTRDSVLHLAVTAADRALSAGPPTADIWVTQAIVRRMVDPTDLTPALRAIRQALALDSSQAPAWHYLALDLAESGNLEAALRAWRRSVAADPKYVQSLVFLGLGYYWRHQYDSAAWWADSAVTQEPTFLLARPTAGYIAVERGQFGRARAAFAAARRLSTDVELVNSLAGSALVEARAGAPGAARAILQKAESLAAGDSQPGVHTAVDFAQAYAALGDTVHAMDWLERYTPHEDLHYQLHLRCDPPFAPLAAMPRFRALLVFPRPPGSLGC